MTVDFSEPANGEADTYQTVQETGEPGQPTARWQRIKNAAATFKDDWRQVKKTTRILGQELRQTGRVLKKAVKTRSFKELATPNNPLATLAMEVTGIEGGQVFQPYFRPEVDDDLANNEVNGAFKHPHYYGLKGFRVVNLHLESGETTTAWYHPPEKGFPTIAYCHGALGTLYDRKGQLEEFSTRGFGVIMAAYPGMKNNRKPPAGQITILKNQRVPAADPSEETCVETGRAMVLYLLNEQLGRKEHDARARKRLEHRGTYLKAPPEEDPMHKIILFGESLGSAVALQTALLLEKGEDGEQVKWDALSGRLPFKSYESQEDYETDIKTAYDDVRASHRDTKKNHGYIPTDDEIQDACDVRDSDKGKYGREPLSVPAVICWAPCTSLPERAQEEFPEFNADFWLKNRFETKNVIGKINYENTKVLMMHGLNDEFIHPENTEQLLVYSGENSGKASGFNADAEFLPGCNHGSTFTRESWRQDPAQLQMIGDIAQTYIANMGLCPPVRERTPGEKHELHKARSIRTDRGEELWADNIHAPQDQATLPEH